jgi:peroxiredoxin Q/BCP
MLTFTCTRHLATCNEETTTVTQGNTAPNFTLETDKGAKVTLSQLRGRQVVLFFFCPKDDTPGCTIECKEFRDAAPNFEGKALVFGVSADDRASHEAFRDKFSLKFPALRCRAQSLRRLRRLGSDQVGRWDPADDCDGGRGWCHQGGSENVTPQGHAAEVLAAL